MAEKMLLETAEAEGAGLADASFGAAIDNFCLHMLVVDADRRRYLAHVRRVLAPSALAYFHENYTDRPIAGPVDTFDDFVSRGGFRPGQLDDRTVLRDGVPLKIRLARLPCRAQDEAGYRNDLERAGLAVQQFVRGGAGHCVIHARRAR